MGKANIDRRRLFRLRNQGEGRNYRFLWDLIFSGEQTLDCSLCIYMYVYIDF